MHTFSEVATWLAFVAGVWELSAGAATLLRGKVVLPRLRRRVYWQPWGWAQVLFGLFVVAATVPRIAHGSSGLVLGFSLLALLPLGASLTLMRRARIGPL